MGNLGDLGALGLPPDLLRAGAHDDSVQGSAQEPLPAFASQREGKKEGKKAKKGRKEGKKKRRKEGDSEGTPKLCVAKPAGKSERGSHDVKRSKMWLIHQNLRRGCFSVTRSGMRNVG